MPPKDTESPDEALELKKRARRRLVGAAALALLAAIVLPMVMDQEQQKSAHEVEVRIPSQDTDSFSARIPPAKSGSTVETAPKPATVAESAIKPETTPEPKPETKPVTKPEPAKQAAKPPETVKPSAPAKPAEKPAAKPAEPTKPSAKNEEVRALAALSGAEVADQWVVQLGAYKDAANVTNLVAKIKQMGLPTFTEPFESSAGPRTRVRAGPFKSREAAERARERISKIGVEGKVAQQ